MTRDQNASVGKKNIIAGVGAQREREEASSFDLIKIASCLCCMVNLQISLQYILARAIEVPEVNVRCLRLAV